MSAPTVLVATAAIIVLSAFFVAVEFATLGAKRHRLEANAASSTASRVALRNANELTVLLAGCQLGITACTLALGHVTKPAVHHWITPAAEALGAPRWTADVVGFVLALLLVTFLHLVVGEMAPKSWAIAHPERSATMLALPMRAVMVVTRPLLLAINEAANWLVRRAGFEPAEAVATGQNQDDLRHLVEHSVEVGTLDGVSSAQLRGALDLQRLTVEELTAGQRRPISVPETATAADVRRAARDSGHLRILVDRAGRTTGVVHVRDTLLLPGDAPITEVTHPVFELDAGTPLHAALSRMREASNHLALVRATGGAKVVTISDILGRVLPAETEPAAAGTDQGR
ncbi:CNNM domain-containing protein [Georgenia deserti]|uniref:CNNM domain-containing protein n=1 Tax=Georgenia deserti TaxID=2093781 RepID=A0ABW4L850_9MICO